MSIKGKPRNRKRQPAQRPQLLPADSRTTLPRTYGLQPGELGVIPDPKDPTRVHSYMLADGTQIKLNNDTVPSNVPPLEPSLIVTSRMN